MARPSSLLIPLLCGLILQSLPARASVSYEFCVLRMSDANTEQFGARYNFGDLDPGREAARVLVSQKSKQANTTAVEVNAYDESKCGPIRDETNVTATAEQLQQLGAAISGGDIAKAGVVATEIYVGVTVKQVDAVKDLGEKAGKTICKAFGC